MMEESAGGLRGVLFLGEFVVVVVVVVVVGEDRARKLRGNGGVSGVPRCIG